MLYVFYVSMWLAYVGWWIKDQKMDYEKLKLLADLKNAGEISAEEFEREKEKLRNEKPSPFARGAKLGIEDNSYYMLMHFSLYFTFIPVLGLFLPVTLWLLNKDADKNVDMHGRNIMNWMLTTVFICLCAVFLFPVGIFILGVMLLLNLIFPMVAAFKAKKGQIWRYPMSIRFLPVVSNQ